MPLPADTSGMFVGPSGPGGSGEMSLRQLLRAAIAILSRDAAPDRIIEPENMEAVSEFIASFQAIAQEAAPAAQAQPEDDMSSEPYGEGGDVEPVSDLPADTEYYGG